MARLATDDTEEPDGVPMDELCAELIDPTKLPIFTVTWDVSSRSDKEKFVRLSEYEKRGHLVLTVRPPSFHLPTSCPRCLSTYLYLCLAKKPFIVEHSNADNLNFLIIEWNLLTAFGNDVDKFLQSTVMCDFDVGLSELEEKSKLHTCHGRSTGMAQGKTMSRLGNSQARQTEIYGRALRSYKDLSLVIQVNKDSKYLCGMRPTSLDAMLITHILFVKRVSLENSILRAALDLAHPELINYANLGITLITWQCVFGLQSKIILQSKLRVV
ncbi:hypothetical protein SELMODRAFT_422696 [Selaginella moellendorffii]|uniref:Metaxin glutathione S-transferase domain-containing protein n=1 Tax=Selaginella moellendorffii TaxID=88036 RepID=D8SJ92_SELML|nr:hypothetical protein SELMODRAFT_422696 [Selaginella moellendorffii]